MRPFYHEIDKELEVYRKVNVTFPPHLHKYLECIYVTEGSFRLGVEDQWTVVGPHDFVLIFPDVIHQFQALTEEPEAGAEPGGELAPKGMSVPEGMPAPGAASTPSRGIYLLGTPLVAGAFGELLRQYCPEHPVIRSSQVPPEIPRILYTLLEMGQEPYRTVLQQSYVQVLLARALPLCGLVKKKETEQPGLAGQAVSYISRHFAEELTLSMLARELLVSPYVLSRMFSGVLHTGFNQYLNEIRLDYASQLLRTTGKPVTDIFTECGFGSQTTFNRVFQQKFGLSPREYRRQSRGPEAPGQQNREQGQQSREQKGAEGPGNRPAASRNQASGEGPKEGQAADDYPWIIAKGYFL